MPPKITCLPNGPYRVPAPGPALRRAGGETYDIAGGTALCRCGGSKRKPFCDGTHRTNGFSDIKLRDGSLDRRESYAGRRITIHDNRGICAHAGYCTDSLKSVFRMGREPWIDPDGAQAKAIVETIRKCPSGALSYSVDAVEHRDTQREAAVLVTDHGPYAVTGGIELADVPFGEGASREHYTLCRCGASKNKPFCDGSHWHVGFRDPA
ncbi:MAG TPA: CDGSH iron-sulfur domain-containing protein [Burkholderiales bacterium]|nr:CDGSH iron-sulfur domain-containing protein [Burkholderiales bacterium]